MIQIFNECCLKGLPARIADKSVDLILVDLPYGTTVISWDKILNMSCMGTSLSAISNHMEILSYLGSNQSQVNLCLRTMKWAIRFGMEKKQSWRIHVCAIQASC